MTLRLRAAFSPNPRIAPLVDGTVQPRGIELAWDTGSAGELHEAHLRDAAHDVFEFSISNYIVTRERFRALWDWVMIPVYASKATLGLNTLVNVDSGICGAEDLSGRRFGIPDYTMTAGLWFRAQLRQMYGVGTRDLEWYVGRQGEQSHGNQLGFDKQPPEGVQLHHVPGGDVNGMLQTGTLDAAFPAEDVPIDATTAKVVRLFRDRGRAFFAEYHARTTYLPVNHVVLVRREVAEREPWVAEALLEAFEHAKQEAYRRDPAARGVFRQGNDDLPWQAAEFGDDPFPYGVAANAAMLRTAAEQSHLDGLTSKPWDLVEFVAERVVGT